MATGITERKGAKGTSYLVRVRTVETGAAICKTFKNLKEAKAWQVDTLNKLNKGEGVARADVARLTVGNAFDDYTATQNPTEKEALRIEALRGDFEIFPILNLTPVKVGAWVKELEKQKVKGQANKTKTHRLYNGDTPRTYAASTVRKFFYTLKKVVEWHARQHRYPFQTPFKGVKLPVEDNSRDRRFKADEEALMMAICEQMPNAHHLKTVISFALETAMRAGEILQMTWGMVDFKGRRVVLPADITKTSKAREVPLTTIALKLLEAYKGSTKNPSERVFTTWQSSQTLGRSFRLLCFTAKIEDFKFHDLRHEATSRFFERTTLRDIEIASITGHKEMKMLKRYANLRATDLALKLW